MPCSKLEVSTVQHGTLSGTGYLHQSLMVHVEALEAYARAEPLPWSTVFAARGRCLAAVLRGDFRDGLFEDLKRVRAELVSAGFKPFLAEVDDALTASR